MIDHISLDVRDVKRAAAFYDAVLAPLGMNPSCTWTFLGVFVWDPDSNKIEACRHAPE